MKIVQVVESFGAGVLNSVALTCNCLVQAGCEVHVVHGIREDTPANYRDFFPAQVKLHEFPLRRAFSLRGLSTVLALRRTLRAIQPDVVHLHSSIAGGAGRLAALGWGGRVKVFYSPRGFSFLTRKSVGAAAYYAMEWLLAKISPARIVACSRSELAYALKLNPSARLIENAVNSKLVIPKHARDPASRLTVGTIGRIASQKAPDCFASICSSISARRGDVDFVWLGSGEEDYTARLGQAGVKVSGWLPRNAVYERLADMDVYLQTSIFEGMPLSVIEAQLAGVPCVVTDVVGNRDVVIDGETGFVAADTAQLIQRIESLLDSAEMRGKMGGTAASLAQARFSETRYAAELTSLYSA